MLYYYIDKAVDINKNILLCRLFYSVLALGKIVYIQDYSYKLQDNDFEDVWNKISRCKKVSQDSH